MAPHVLTFEPNPAHQYFLDGVQLPSVTQVLRDSGLIDFSGIPPGILERARKRGSAVHELALYLNENDLDWRSVDPEYKGYLDGWIAYCEQKRLRFDLGEYRIASPRRRVAGTLDVLGSIEDEGVQEGDGALIDIKTGEPSDVKAHLQTGAYLGMAYEWAAFDPTLAAVLANYKRVHRYAVRLRKNGTFHVTPYTDPRDTAKFYVLVEAWHIKQEEGVIVPLSEIAA